ncbi:mechanosensitive ion channel [Aerococcaceae bacterium DSM 111176]|nr:mechanosensitive ion channel [Aerococcaceae bacterium DSM 111176]
MDEIREFVTNVVELIPRAFLALVILLLALLVSFFLKRLAINGLNKINFNQKVIDWGIAKNEEEGKTYVETFGSVVYFIVFLFFLPSILNGLNIGGVMNPIINALETAFGYIPNVILAALILIVGAYFCSFIRKLVKNILSGLNIDKWYLKLTKQYELNTDNDHQIADVVATIVYVLIYVPILTIALETLAITSISEPIINVLNQIMSAIPKIVAAVVMLTIGGFIAKLVGDLLESLVSTTGIDRFSNYLNVRQEKSDIQISTILGNITKIVLMIFFLVEAVNMLGLEVLNAIGASVIAYLPFVLSALVILGLVLIGGNVLAIVTTTATGDKFSGQAIRYLVIALGVFMILEQLQIAQTIVNAGFIIILSSLGITLALAFGLGGRDFASKQLEKLDQAIEEEEPIQPVNEDENTQDGE